MPIGHCPLIFTLATCHGREDAYDVPVFDRLLLLPMDAVDQDDLRNLIGYFESFQNILDPGVAIHLHPAGKTTAPLGKIIS
jgi:hypothetical protein